MLNNQTSLPLLIRPLRESDVTTIRQIIESLPLQFSEHDRPLIDRDIQLFLSQSDNYAEVHIAVAELEQQTIGFITYHPDQDSDTYGYISWLAVNQHVQTRGVGTQLLEHACAELHHAGLKYVTLKTLDTTYNESVKQFYERRGFQRAGRLPKYYFQPFATGGVLEDCALYYKVLG